MNAAPALAPVTLLALARLLAASDKGETRARVGKDLAPLVAGLGQGASWDDRLDRILDEGEAGGTIDRVRDKKGKPTAKLVLTEEGRRAVLGALGMDELPARTTWKTLCATHLTALALGRPDASDARALAAAPGLRAAILREKFSLDPETPTKDLAGATAAKLLGLEPGQKFNKDVILAKLLRDAGLDLPEKAKGGLTLGDIQDALFRRELGDGHAAAGKPLEVLAARAVGASKNTAPELGAAVLRSWVDRSEPSAGSDSSVIAPAEPEGPTADGLDLEEFARRVVEAARRSPTGWFGDAKVFIAQVWNVLREDPSFRGMDVSEFKKRLVEAHQANLLELSRADLVESMDPADVSGSATPYLNAVYHFVRTEEPGR